MTSSLALAARSARPLCGAGFGVFDFLRFCASTLDEETSNASISSRATKDERDWLKTRRNPELHVWLSRSFAFVICPILIISYRRSVRRCAIAEPSRLARLV